MTVAASAILSPLPGIDNLYVVTVGTTATTAEDLFSKFSVASDRSRARLTIRADGEISYICGDASVPAPDKATAGDPSTAGLCRTVPADTPEARTLRYSHRFIRIVAANADTRVEIELEKGVA